MGFVVREHGREDRRTVFVGLSPKGKKVLQEVDQQRRRGVMQLFSRISAREREEYLRILEKIVESFRTIAINQNEPKEGF
jgi:DNA-binding MarR family transcriptional regulator